MKSGMQFFCEQNNDMIVAVLMYREAAIVILHESRTVRIAVLAKTIALILDHLLFHPMLQVAGEMSISISSAAGLSPQFQAIFRNIPKSFAQDKDASACISSRVPTNWVTHASHLICAVLNGLSLHPTHRAPLTADLIIMLTRVP